jgi:hypothetical protein
MFVAKQVGHSNARTLFEHYAGYIKDDYDGSKIRKIKELDIGLNLDSRRNIEDILLKRLTDSKI